MRENDWMNIDVISESQINKKNKKINDEGKVITNNSGNIRCYLLIQIGITFCLKCCCGRNEATTIKLYFSFVILTRDRS